jgi:hypothetical protein
MLETSRYTAAFKKIHQSSLLGLCSLATPRFLNCMPVSKSVLLGHGQATFDYTMMTATSYPGKPQMPSFPLKTCQSFLWVYIVAFVPPNNLADPPTYVDVTLTVHAAEPRNISGGTPNTPNGSVCFPIHLVHFADPLGQQKTQFMERVRARDQRCIISDWSAPFWTGLQACHIVPRCHSARVSDPLQSYPTHICALVASRSAVFTPCTSNRPRPLGRMEPDWQCSKWDFLKYDFASNVG